MENCDKLPLKENRAKYLTRRYGNMYNTNISRRSWHTANERNPYKLAHRLLSHYIDKNFDDFFSDLSSRCKHNDLLMEYKFFFRNLIVSEKVKCSRSFPYYIDNNNIIRRCETKRRKQKRLKQVDPKKWYQNRTSVRVEERKKIETHYNFVRDEQKENFIS